MLRIPGLIDPHVHMRDPGATHKEDWATGTAAALAGGFTAVLAMPNMKPPVIDANGLEQALAAAGAKARCDYAQYLGAGVVNVSIAFRIAPQVAGLKMYLDQTYGPLRLDQMSDWLAHFRRWPFNSPVVVHAEDRTMAAAILGAALAGRSVHIAHVALREEILLIKAAKAHGLAVTCEVSPHHLFLTENDIQAIGPGRSEVRPRLATPADQQALWDHLEVIDCFASDHAPHTLAEKDGENPPPGFPGLETSVPLMLTAVHEGRLTLDDLVLRMHTNPRRIFNLLEQLETWVEIDPDQRWEIQASNQYTRCGWTPFEGYPVTGKVLRVVLRGKTVFENEKVLAEEGYGRDLRSAR